VTLDLLLVCLALALSLPTVGYALALEAAGRARRVRPGPPDPSGDPPRVAVVLPVLDEARFIDDRLRDFAESDYPADRLELWVVDGGSRDATPARAEAAAARDPRIRLLRVEGARSKLEQVGVALEKIRTPVVVVSDADVALAPDGVRALVRELAADPRTAIVGAHVEPDTPLLEERLHWWLLGRISRLEGRLGATLVAAPCYALRPEAVTRPLPPDLSADDVHLGLAARADGWRTVRSSSARARELRVPRDLPELFRFRRRRGAGARRAVGALLLRPGLGARARARLAFRYWQLGVTPWLGLALAVAAPFAGTRGAALVLGLLALAGVPWLVAVRRDPAFAAARRPVWRLPLAGLRLAAAGAVALLTGRERGGPR
jgi:cellulose synthase/poly-beta-1,6-N-acetylglucosamine synthase-like glycosyltransferase